MNSHLLRSESESQAAQWQLPMPNCKFSSRKKSAQLFFAIRIKSPPCWPLIEMLPLRANNSSKRPLAILKKICWRRSARAEIANSLMRQFVAEADGRPEKYDRN